MTNGVMMLRSGIQTSLLEEGLREVTFEPFNKSNFGHPPSSSPSADGRNPNLTLNLIIPN
jgi:hypothetical protein